MVLGQLQPHPDRPDVFGLERPFLADDPAFVPSRPAITSAILPITRDVVCSAPRSITVYRPFCGFSSSAAFGLRKLTPIIRQSTSARANPSSA